MFILERECHQHIPSASTYRSTPLDVFNQVVHLDRLQEPQHSTDIKVCVHRAINRHGHCLS